jgi:type II secretory ATPase GspE/PulE/Tfp pilus assembly ATPase PilB-like protein
MLAPVLIDSGQGGAVIEQRLGQTLVERAILDATELEYVRQKRAIGERHLWQVLIEEGLVDEMQVTRMLGEILGLEVVEVDRLEAPDRTVLALFNKEFCLLGGFLPLRRRGDKLLVLLGDALPAEVAQRVLRRVGLACEFVLGPFSHVARLTKHTFYFAFNPPEKNVEREVRVLAGDADSTHAPDALLDNILHWAVRERATDIHLTHSSSSLHILFRIDGVLQPITAMPMLLSRLLGFIKLRAEMDIAEHRRPQDGSFRVQVLDTQITVRVSTIVAEFGERMVMRLLPESRDAKDLLTLGYFAEDVAVIARTMSSPVGLALMTGPTGSGKSSTLHAGLRQQRLVERNVLTVEDPLEYRVCVAGQTEVNRRAGYDFSVALRHFLRHDPDVILVGEMRDAETARAAFDAAATGHLVLSTLHVTTVFGVVPRLRPMGLQPQEIAENLRLVINQRLVRRNCPHCSRPVALTTAECRWLGVPPDTEGSRGAGCSSCRFTGFMGRLPLYEMLEVNETLANAIADDAGREAIRRLAHDNGFRPIVELGKRRVLAGQTTSEEVFRVVGEGPTA